MGEELKVIAEAILKISDRLKNDPNEQEFSNIALDLETELYELSKVSRVLSRFTHC